MSRGHKCMSHLSMKKNSYLWINTDEATILLDVLFTIVNIKSCGDIIILSFILLLVLLYFLVNAFLSLHLIILLSF